MRTQPAWHIELLADHPDLIPAVGEMRWREWSHWRDPPESEAVTWWVDVARRESGRAELPVTFVGLDAGGALAGAAGIDRFDPPEFQDRGPWVIGVIVAPALRGQGAGRALLAHALRWAAGQAYDPVWVATGPEAAGFYQRCGWELTHTYHREHHDGAIHILRHRDGVSA
ncbi:MAG TPA: GNAT family N-acetyltransferase [Streptosporangiaceae bacterium]